MTFLDDILKPIDNITSGVGQGIAGLGAGVGAGVGAIGKGVGTGVGAVGGGMGSIYKGFGKLASSPLTLIILVIGGVVVLKFI